MICAMSQYCSRIHAQLRVLSVTLHLEPQSLPVPRMTCKNSMQLPLTKAADFQLMIHLPARNCDDGVMCISYSADNAILDQVEP